MSKTATTAEPDDLPEIDWSRAKIIRRGPRKDHRFPLKVLRVAVDKTQVEVAETAGMDQGDVSRLEQREDALVSTLRRYVEALGGELEIRAVFKKTGHNFRIDM